MEVSSLPQPGCSAGRRAQLDALLPLVYEPLRQIAARHLGGERAGYRLSPTALVHETYLKLATLRHIHWHDRAHLMAMASRLMRRILIDEAHRRRAFKRGGGLQPAPWHEALRCPDLDAYRYAEAALDLRVALARLEAAWPRQRQILHFHFFCGLTLAETADVLELSPSTVKREWRLARAWLVRFLAPAPFAD